MRRLLLSLTAVLGTLVVLAGPAAAQIVELGPKPPTTSPSCPGTPCLVVDRTTGFQVAVGAQRNISVVPANGRIVAWTVTLAMPSPTQISSFNSRLGGPPSAQIAILRPVPRPKTTRGPRPPQRYRLIATSDLQALTPYLGQTAQFPLVTTLGVRKGDIVALTIPTWAPVLAVGMDSATIWRSSRPKAGCNDTITPTAQTVLSSQNVYACSYKTARLTYSATLITAPKPNPPPKKTKK